MLRLAMVDAGLPEPNLQLTLRSGDPLSPSADLGYRAQRLAIQYDGGHHLVEAQSLVTNGETRPLKLRDGPS